MTYHRTLLAHIDVVPALKPQAGSGSAQASRFVDVRDFGSAAAAVAFATSGGVTGGTVRVQFRDAMDLAGTGAADFGSPVILTIPAGPNADGVVKAGIDVTGARGFLGFAVTVIPTGGAPASIVSGALVLGNSIRSLVA